MKREQEQDDDAIAVHTDTFEISRNALGQDLPADYYRNWHFIGTVLGCILANNSQILPYILSANAIFAIQADIGPSNNAVWINICYTLSVAACLLIAGRLSDVFGRRWFVVGANFSNCVGCIIAGTAKNVETIVGGMVFIGIGAAVQVSFPTIISELVPKKHRPIWVGLLYSTSIMPYGFGPVVAQELVANTAAGWRWCFYLGIIVAGCSTLCYLLCYFPPDFQMLHVHRSPWEQLKRQDYIGALLFVAGLTLFLIGLNWGGVVYPWKSGQVLATLIVGLAALVAFAIFETFFSQDQILPTHLFKAKGFLAVTVCASVGTCVAFSMAVLWPQQVALLLPGSPTKQGLLTSVQGCATLLGFFCAGLVFHWVRMHKVAFVVSTAIMAAMAGAMVSMQPGDFTKGPVFISFLGFFIGIVETGSRALLPLTCPDEDIGAALGAMGSIGYAFASVATAVYTTILNNKVRSIVPMKVQAVGIGAGLNSTSVDALLASYATNLTLVPGMTVDIAAAVQVEVTKGYADSFRFVWYAALAFAICAWVASFFVPNYGAYYTDEVSRKMQYKGVVLRDTQDSVKEMENGTKDSDGV